MASRRDAAAHDDDRQRARNSFCESEAADWRSSLAEDEVFSWPRPQTLRLRRTALGFGFTLRHFIVYPPESAAHHAFQFQQEEDHARRGRPRNRLEPMDTIFVKQVKEGGPAHGAGLCTGDRIVKVNGASIIGKAYCQVIALIQDSGDFLDLCVMPKDDDVLQLAYSQDAYPRGQGSFSGTARLIPAPPPPCYPRVESSAAAMAQTTSDPVGRGPAPPPDHGYRKEIPVPPSPPRCYGKSQTAVCMRNDGMRTVVVPQSAALLAGRMAPAHRLDFMDPVFARGARPGSLAQYPPPRKADVYPGPLGAGLYGGPPPLCPGNHQNIDWRTYQTYREYIDNKGIHSHASRTIQERLDNLRGANQPPFGAPHHIPAGDWTRRCVRRRSTSHERSYQASPPHIQVAPRSASQDRILGGEKMSHARNWPPRSASQDGLVHKARAQSLDYADSAELGRHGEPRGGYGRAEPGGRPSRQAMPRHARMYRPSAGFSGATRPPPNPSLYSKGPESFQTRSSPMLHDRPPPFSKSSSADHSFSDRRVPVKALATQHGVKRIRAESLQPHEAGRQPAAGPRSSSCSAPKEAPQRPGILKAPPPGEDGVRQLNGRSPAKPEVVLREKPASGKQPSPLRQPSYILALSDEAADAAADTVAACWLPNDARREIHIRRLEEQRHASCSSNLDESLNLIPFIDEPVSPSVDREAAPIPPSAVISVAQSVTTGPSSQGSPCPPIRRQLSHDQESLCSALLDSQSTDKPERSKSYDEGLNTYQQESRGRSSSKNMTSFRGPRKTLDGIKPPDSGSRRDSSSDVFADSSKEGLLNFRQLGTDKNKRVGGGLRSWKQMYAVLQGPTLTLYRDRKDALTHASTPCEDEPPQQISITACLVDISYSDTRRKNVLRLTTSHCGFLFQAEGREDMLAWIRVIQDCSNPDEENAAVTSQELISRKIREYNMMSAPAGRAEPSPKSSRQSLSIKQAFLGGKTEGRILSPHSPRPGEERRTPRAEDSSGDRTWRLGIAGMMRKPFEKKPPAGITFGVRLDDCPPAQNNRLVPLIVEVCCQVVEERGLDYTGIYRVPGNTAAISSMQDELNSKGMADIDITEDKWRELNVISSLLKSFFRKLPEPLFTNEKYANFIEASRREDSVERLKELKKLIYELPDHHYETLKFLCSHLKKVSENCEKNKMEPRNLAIVFGPTLVRTSEDNMANMVNHMPDQCKIVENLIQQHDWFFSHDGDQDPVTCSEQENAVQSQPVPNIDHLLCNIGRTAASPGEQSDSTCSDSSRSKGLWGGRDQVSREMLRSSFFVNRKRKKPKDKVLPSSSDDDLDSALLKKEVQEEEQQPQEEEEPLKEEEQEEEPRWVHQQEEEEVRMEGSRDEEEQQEGEEPVEVGPSPTPGPSPSPPASPSVASVSDLGTLNSTGSVASAPRGRRGGAAPPGGAEVASITSDYSTTSSTAFLPGAELLGPEAPGGPDDDADDERSELVSEGRAAETDSESDLSVFTVGRAEPKDVPRQLPAHRLIEGDTLARKKAAAAKTGSESSLERDSSRPAQRRSTASLGSARSEPEGAEPAWRLKITDRLKVRLRVSVDDMFGVGSQRAPEARGKKKKNIRRRHTMGGQRDFAQLSVLDGWAAAGGAESRSELSAVDRLKPKCSSQDFSIGDWIARERHRTSNPEVSLDLGDGLGGASAFPDPAPRRQADAHNGDTPPSKNLSLSADAHPHKLTSSHVVHSRFYQYL